MNNEQQRGQPGSDKKQVPPQNKDFKKDAKQKKFDDDAEFGSCADKGGSCGSMDSDSDIEE
jgi:hypothetical protein